MFRVVLRFKMNIIELENIGKKYILQYEKGAFIKDVLPRLFIPKEKREFWALRNINLALEKGESLGLIGRNGAGKSTFLNILAGISSPTEGKVEVRGKVSTLLTLGAGFHPELTGIDNIYLNGVILGLKIGEIKNRIKEIIEFSELKDFIKQPLYTYSSGMILRLGFSIAVHIDFDILLMDEILSVGDIPFQEKCLKKIGAFKETAKTLIIASQSLDLIKALCHRALLLEKGRGILLDEPEKVISRYLELVQKETVQKTKESQYPYYPKYPDDIEKIKTGWETRIGTGEARILEVKLRDKKGKERNAFQTGESLRIDVKYKVEKEIKGPHFGVAVFREDYLYCYGPNTRFDGIKIKKLRKGIGNFSIEFKNIILGSGDYRLSIAVWNKDENNPYDYRYAYYKFKIFGDGKEEKSLLDIPCSLSINGKRLRKSASAFLKKIIKESVAEDLVGIEKPRISGRWGKEKKAFNPNENLRILLRIKILRIINAPFVRISLHNEDGILIQESCFDTGKDITPPDARLSLYYPGMPLLRGKYSLSIGIGSKKNPEGYQYMLSLANVEFQTNRKDHGIVYIPHRWRLKNP